MRKRIAVIATFVVGLYFFVEFLVPPFVGGGFDNTRMDDPCLVLTDSGVRLYYTGARSRKGSDEVHLAIGLAESADGTSWTKHPGNALLARSTLSSKDWRGLSHAAVVREPDGAYTMFYVGHGADTVDRIMRATSSDGLKWKRGGVVLNLAKSDYERTSITALTVLREPAQYVAYFGATYVVGDRAVSGVSRATSEDGVRWTLDEHNPVLPIETENGWDYQTITGLSVVSDDEGLRLYYAGTKTVFTGGGYLVTLIGMATSADGVAWERHADNPIFGPALFRDLSGPDRVARFEDILARASDPESEDGLGDMPEGVFDTLSVAGLSVARPGDGYLLAYAGSSDLGGSGQRIGFAASEDGVTWQPLGEAEPLALGSRSRSTVLSSIYLKVTKVFIVIGAMAIGLGVVGLGKLHGGQIIKGHKDRAYSLAFFLSLIISLVIIFVGQRAGQTTSGYKLFRLIRTGLIFSFGASSMGLLTFYLASASYRSFKLKNAEAGLMMAAAVLVMLGQVPLGQLLTSWLSEPYQIQNVSTSMAYTIVTPVMRAIKIGAAIGGLVLATRLWLSMERRRD